ncbi:MAG: hypothetical protein KKB25_02810 [Nanoarchaeota archaeon]|nr:hypothetical protein [Nanoarchaeota archaeon]
MRHKKLFALFALFLIFGFLGLPIPEWLSGFVSSLAGAIAAAVAGFSKLVGFAQLFVRF